MAFFDFRGFIGGVLASQDADPITTLLGGLAPKGVTASAATATPVTIMTLPVLAGWSVYLVSATRNNVNDAANYNTTAIVSTNGTAARITTLQSGALLTITLSGLNVQATQSSGGAAVITYSIFKITP